MFNIRNLLAPLIFASGFILSASAAQGRRCASAPTQEQIKKAESHFSQNRVASPADRKSYSHVVDVYFHVISEDETSDGYVSDDQIQQQMDVLNTGYTETGLSFALVDTTRTVNYTWFHYAGPNSTYTIEIQNEMKHALRRGDASVLNVYTVGFTAEENKGILGYATFPYDYQEDPENDGVVLVYASLPGGNNDGPYNEGKTLVHETGHWTGLYHTFEGGCDGKGDQVADTPPQAYASEGCPVGQDSCLGGGVDDIHNYMDYSNDSCLWRFTLGQVVRLRDQIATYRGLGYF